ncbi:MAG TPA: hypothetical protein VHI52_04190, partial [Verrucomicrobiae bacterium]|nr:hypothetical protein [Verrucomicrobiae bacterium]
MNADPGAVNRRQFIRLTAAMAATGTLTAVASTTPTSGQALKAVAFDALAIFDPRPIFSRVEELF